MRILTQLLALATRAPSLARTRTLPQADKWQALLKTLLARALPTVAELLVDDKLHEEAHRDHMQRSASGKGTASTKTSAKGSQAEGAPGSAASGGEGAASVPGFGGEKKPALPSSLDKVWHPLACQCAWAPATTAGAVGACSRAATLEL